MNRKVKREFLAKKQKEMEEAHDQRDYITLRQAMFELEDFGLKNLYKI